MKIKNGFTLIELLIALAILAILGAVAVPIYRGYMTNSAKSEAKSNLQTLSMLLDTYYSDNTQYAPANDTYEWKESPATNEFSSWLSSFQPRKASGGAMANYDYTLVTTQTSTTADTYTATASPRSGTTVAGSGNLTIIQNGTKTGW